MLIFLRKSTATTPILLFRLIAYDTLVLVAFVPHARQVKLHVLVNKKGHTGRGKHPDDIWTQSKQYQSIKGPW